MAARVVRRCAGTAAEAGRPRQGRAPDPADATGGQARSARVARASVERAERESTPASAAASAVLKRGLPPQIPPSTRMLLLGSFPGEESLRQAQYYAHPQNQFWRLLGDVIGEPLGALPYAKRFPVLRRHRIGVWDIITDCEREGSLDTAIRKASFAQYDWLAQHAPQLRVVAMNGKKAGTAASRLAALGYETLVLPSSSPAYTFPYAEKLRAWRALEAHLIGRG